jgi:hypothetical protein
MNRNIAYDFSYSMFGFAVFLRAYIFCTNISINVLFVPFGANLAQQMSKWATGKIHPYRRSPHEETAPAAVFV